MTWKKGQSGNPRGRKKSPEKQAAEELVRKAFAEGTTPLQVILEAMREAYDEGGAQAAVPYAKEAAPYMHPKLANVETTVEGVLGTYAAQPIPVESRDSDAMASTNGASANGHST